MAKTIVEFRCLLISPSDVEAERGALSEVVGLWNAQIGAALGAKIDLVRWETHGIPDASGSAQAILNRQIVDGCDFGIAVFWARLGGPTAEYESGSVEEIQRLRERGAQVMIYFSTAPVPQTLLTDGQFKNLSEMKAKLQAEGLLGSYISIGDLREKVMLNLTSVVSALLESQRGQPSPVTIRPALLTAPTPDVRILVYPAETYPPTPGIKHLLGIRVQNYSPVVVLIAGISILKTSNRALWLYRDAVTGIEQRRQPLRPGESLLWSASGDALLLDGPIEEFTDVVVQDDIGREYRSPEGALRRILQKYADENAARAAVP